MVANAPESNSNSAAEHTLAMLLAAQRKGWTIHYMQQKDLYSAQGTSRSNMTSLEVRDDPQSWFTLGESGDKPPALAAPVAASIVGAMSCCPEINIWVSHTQMAQV